MATLPKFAIEPTEPKLTLDEAAAELYRIVEGHFDELGLSEQERDERYGKLRKSLDTKDAVLSKA